MERNIDTDTEDDTDDATKLRSFSSGGGATSLGSSSCWEDDGTVPDYLTFDFEGVVMFGLRLATVAANK